MFRIIPARDSEDDDSFPKYFVFGKEVPGDIFSDYLGSLRIQGITVIAGESFFLRQKFETIDRLLDDVSPGMDSSIFGMDSSILEKSEEVKQSLMDLKNLIFSGRTDQGIPLYSESQMMAARRKLLKNNLVQAKYETVNVKE